MYDVYHYYKDTILHKHNNLSGPLTEEQADKEVAWINSLGHNWRGVKVRLAK